MATINTKPQAGKANKEGKLPISTFYFHEGVPFVIAIGESVLHDHFDRARNRVTKKDPRHLEINAKIQEVEWRLNKCITYATKFNLNPTRKLIKERYEIELEEEAIEKERLQKQAVLLKREDVLEFWNTEFIREEIQEAKVSIDEKEKILKSSKYFTNDDDELVKEIMRQYDKMVFEKDVEKNTLKIYKTFRKLFFGDFYTSKTFLDAKRNMNVSIHPEYADKTFYKVFLDYLIKEKNFKNNTIGKITKTLKQLYTFLDLSSNIKVNKEYKTFKHYKETLEDFVIINEEEFELIWNFPYDQLIDRQHKIKDFFCFSLLTGLRISECKNERFEVVKLNGKEYLHGATRKNRSEYLIPLWKDERLKFILEKYEWNMYLCSEVEFNRQVKLMVKKIYEHYNINQEPIKQTRTVLKQKVVVATKFKYELISHRTARRSAISRFYYSWGLKREQISALLGTKKLEILDVYMSREKTEKVKLLENI